MDGVEFLKEQAADFRKTAEGETDPKERARLLDLARRCEELAELMQDCKRDPGKNLA
jgi:hypothetical protein